MENFTYRQKRIQRRGLSFLEFIGCMVAMVGGVFLGLFYLGVDTQKMAVIVLQQAQVIAPSYLNQIAATVSAQPIGEQSPAGDSAQTSANIGGQQPASTSTDVAAPSKSPSNTAATKTTLATSASVPARPEPSGSEQLELTRDYWDKVTGIMLKEANGRLRGAGNPEEWELYDYLSQRKRGHEAALAELEKLDSYGIDDRLADHGDQVIAWHKSGIKLFDYGLSLLSDGPGAKLTGPVAQSWQSAATQLRMEESLVVNRHKAVAKYLNREYASEAPFVPAFQQR